MDSEDGVGTTIYLNLLLDNVAPAVPPDDEGSNHHSLPFRPLRILLADDEPIGQLSMQTMLKRMEHHVITVSNGEEALSALLREDFDVILMDIQMPVMDGVEATRIIRSMSELGGKQRIPIIALTAYAMPGDREKFLEAGMDDHVTKPVQMEEVEKVLLRVPTALTGRQP